MPRPLPPVNITTVLPDEYELVRKLALHIWPEVYREIISGAQIEHMIERMYAPEVIADEIKNGGIHYAWILENGEKIGYLAYGPKAPATACMIHKLYLLPSRHGEGFGGAVLNWLFGALAAAGTSELNLRVNRKNEAAIRCYERNGFRKTAEDCLDIGGGFVMDDFLMCRSLRP